MPGLPVSALRRCPLLTLRPRVLQRSRGGLPSPTQNWLAVVGLLADESARSTPALPRMVWLLSLSEGTLTPRRSPLLRCPGRWDAEHVRQRPETVPAGWPCGGSSPGRPLPPARRWQGKGSRHRRSSNRVVAFDVGTGAC